MDVLTKLCHKGISCIFSIASKAKWGNALRVNGLFRRLPDTQIVISGGGLINIDKNVSFQKRVCLAAVGGELKIGENTAFNRNCLLMCRGNITIGANCMFGPGVTIYDHDHKFSVEGVKTDLNYGSVIIDDGCWIAANVVILRNTHIGEGCVIGAGTVVKGQIPPHSLVASDRKLNIIPLK